MKINLIVIFFIGLSLKAEAASWYDEEIKDPTPTSPPVRSNPLMDAYQRGLNGLDPDGKPIAPPPLPQYRLSPPSLPEPKRLSPEAQKRANEWLKSRPPPPPPPPKTDNALFMEAIWEGVKKNCKGKNGLDYLNCQAEYSPKKCKSLVYDKDRYPWKVCVYSCGSASIYSKNFGECSN